MERPSGENRGFSSERCGCPTTRSTRVRAYDDQFVRVRRRHVDERAAARDRHSGGRRRCPVTPPRRLPRPQSPLRSTNPCRLKGAASSVVPRLKITCPFA